MRAVERGARGEPPPADDSPFERMRYYIREIGQGPKAARDLTRAEARDAMEIILRQEVTRAQTGGFLLIERVKGEAPEGDLGPKHGVPVGDVLEALGVDVDAEPEEVQRSIEEVGFGYMRSARFVPALFALKEVREEI